MSAAFDLVEAVYSGGLAKKADSLGISALTIIQKNLMLAWWAKGEIDNGGFELLYYSPVDVEDVILAFKEVGADDYANACLISKGFFPNKVPPKNLTEKREAVNLIMSKSEDDPWLPCNQIVWANSDLFDMKTYKYIKSNNEHFSEWLQSE